MTPLILVILAAMWAAVLLPPYLRDRNETRAASGNGSLRSRIGALTASLSGSRSYLPVGASGQGVGEVPLPHGARQPIGGPRAVAATPERLPQSSAVQILGPSGQRVSPADGGVARLRPLGAADPVTPVAQPQPVASVSPIDATPAPDAEQAMTATPKPGRSPSAIARQRRRDVLHALLGLAGITLVATVALGGPLLFVHLLADAALGAYIYLLIQRRKVAAEQEIKVAFLPHGGAGVSATALLEQGGGWNPGTRSDNVRVLHASAN